MNKRGHVVNAALLGVGMGYVLEPAGGAATYRSVLAVSLPVVLGALLPDLDTAVGTHRKTFHNLPVLAACYAWPLLFDNLHFVWIGVLCHYVLDLLGTGRGVALFYPLGREYSLPLRLRSGGRYADVSILLVSGAELAVILALRSVDLAVGDLLRAVEVAASVHP